jgi:hypothetical protein
VHACAPVPDALSGANPHTHGRGVQYSVNEPDLVVVKQNAVRTTVEWTYGSYEVKGVTGAKQRRQ